MWVRALVLWRCGKDVIRGAEWSLQSRSMYCIWSLRNSSNFLNVKISISEIIWEGYTVHNSNQILYICVRVSVLQSFTKDEFSMCSLSSMQEKSLFFS